jgi:hypothetical protein
MLGHFAGLKMVSSMYALQDIGERQTRYIKRTWRERLFGKLYGKWRPLKAHKLIVFPVMSPAMYWAGDAFVYHPSLEPEIRRAIARANMESKALGEYTPAFVNNGIWRVGGS